MRAIQMKAEDWENGFAMPGFPIPPDGKFLGGRLESHDPVAGVLRVSYPTKPEYATPAGAVMGGIVATQKTPTHWHEISEWPLTGSGKIQKFVLRDQWVAGAFFHE